MREFGLFTSEACGFWHYPAPGVRTPSEQWMADLLAAQREGRDYTDEARLFLDAGTIVAFPEEDDHGHAVWLDWPWKLHRIRRPDGSLHSELYHLETDPMEQNCRAGVERERWWTMWAQMGIWMVGVRKSLNGEDYP